jgi:fucose 4-O-acetylase-like acetyltransferase
MKNNNEDMVICKNENKINWVYISKGIGIILVVIGHFKPECSPDYWIEIRKIIYQFHMPLFFILSGILFNPAKENFRVLFSKKTKRLLYPFVTVAIVCLILKYLAGLFFNLNHSVNIASIMNILINPVDSYMPLLWFIYTLYLIFLLYPLSIKITKSYSLILIFFIMLNYLKLYNINIINILIYYLPFFAFGVSINQNNLFIQINKFIIIFLIILFALLSYLKFSMDQKFFNTYIIKFFIGILGSIIVIELSKFIASNKIKILNSTLQSIGYFSVTIYLFHTLFESGIRIVFFQVFKIGNCFFGFVATIAILSGIIYPLFLEKYILAKYKLTRKYVLGIS